MEDMQDMPRVAEQDRATEEAAEAARVAAEAARVAAEQAAREEEERRAAEEAARVAAEQAAREEEERRATEEAAEAAEQATREEEERRAAEEAAEAARVAAEQAAREEEEKQPAEGSDTGTMESAEEKKPPELYPSLALFEKDSEREQKDKPTPYSLRPLVLKYIHDFVDANKEVKEEDKAAYNLVNLSEKITTFKTMITGRPSALDASSMQGQAEKACNAVEELQTALKSAVLLAWRNEWLHELLSCMYETFMFKNPDFKSMNDKYAPYGFSDSVGYLMTTLSDKIRLEDAREDLYTFEMERDELHAKLEASMRMAKKDVDNANIVDSSLQDLMAMIEQEKDKLRTQEDQNAKMRNNLDIASKAMEKRIEQIKTDMTKNMFFRESSELRKIFEDIAENRKTIIDLTTETKNWKKQMQEDYDSAAALEKTLQSLAFGWDGDDKLPEVDALQEKLKGVMELLQDVAHTDYKSIPTMKETA